MLSHRQTTINNMGLHYDLDSDSVFPQRDQPNKGPPTTPLLSTLHTQLHSVGAVGSNSASNGW